MTDGRTSRIEAQPPRLPGENPARHLRWDACYNVRDLGGYQTNDGGHTRWRALLRADNLCRLTPVGCAALAEYGVRTILDLRSASELKLAPHPLAQQSVPNGTLAYLNLPAIDETDAAGAAAMDAAESTLEVYCLWIERYRAQMAAIVMAVARAPQGGVLIHCHAGKDRTGLATALLLALAGVAETTIAEDYALSDTYLQPLYEELLSNGPQDPSERERLERQLTSPPETMLSVLTYLDRQHRGVYSYLLESGVTERDIERVRGRLRG